MAAAQDFENHVLAPWRPREQGAALEAFRTEQRREEELFSRLLRRARQENEPLERLFEESMEFFVPGLNENETRLAVNRYATSLSSWRDGLDEEGNPLWISLTLPQRRDDEDGIKPESILSKESPGESASSKSGADQERASASQRRPLIIELFRRFIGKKDEASSKPRRGTIPPPHPRPLRSFFRVLFIAVILALAYRICAQRGWVPRLF